MLAEFILSGGGRMTLDFGNEDGGCLLDTVSPALYKTPEIGCSRCLGFGVTSRGEACGTASSNLGFLDPKDCG